MRRHFRSHYHADLIAYAISGRYMYVLVKVPGNENYLQVYDHNDRVVAEHHVHNKYDHLMLDRDNSGVWLMKKNGKDPLLFDYSYGRLHIYAID
mgnify:FL=1